MWKCAGRKGVVVIARQKAHFGRINWQYDSQATRKFYQMRIEREFAEIEVGEISVTRVSQPKPAMAAPFERNLCKFSCAIEVIFCSYSLKIAWVYSAFTSASPPFRQRNHFFWGCQKLVRVHFLSISLCCLKAEPCSSGHPQRCTNFEIALFRWQRKAQEARTVN